MLYIIRHSEDKPITLDTLRNFLDYISKYLPADTPIMLGVYDEEKDDNVNCQSVNADEEGVVLYNV